MTFIKFLFTKVFLKQLSIAIIALLGLVFIVLFWLKFTTNHNQKIEVPNLAKMSLDTAENKLIELDLRLEVIDSSPNTFGRLLTTLGRPPNHFNASSQTLQEEFLTALGRVIAHLMQTSIY